MTAQGDALAAVDTHEPDADAAELAARLAQVLVLATRADEAKAHLETALIYAEALELPHVISSALSTRALGLIGVGRHNEALISLEGAASIADANDLRREGEMAHGNAGYLRMVGDRPGAADRFEIAVTVAQRRGDRNGEANWLSNLMLVHIFTGQWDRAAGLGAEALADPDRPGAAWLHNRLVLLFALRGEPAVVAAHAEALRDWHDSEDVLLRSMAQAAKATIARSTGDPVAALDFAVRAVAGGMTFGGLSEEAVRQGWPEAVDAAISLGRLDEAERLLAIVADRLLGHVPPYLRAQHARYRARVDAARGDHHRVEAGFTVAEGILAELGYPYWLAQARLDHAVWLTGQDQPDRSTLLAEQAVVVFAELGAAPALTRARRLTPTVAVINVQLAC